MAPGEYDVALLTAARKCARAESVRESRDTEPRPDQSRRPAGRLEPARPPTALQSGAMFPSNSDARVRIAALGPVEPGRRPLLVQPGDRAVSMCRARARFERSATLVLTCDPTNQPDTTCMVGGCIPVGEHGASSARRHRCDDVRRGRTAAGRAGATAGCDREADGWTGIGAGRGRGSRRSARRPCGRRDGDSIAAGLGRSTFNCVWASIAPAMDGATAAAWSRPERPLR